ncbi:MAG TPA: CsbD family protein [Longimicrobiales bacterium]|nr:CsbD family protein [Longimicrobiales bacterium]
MADDLNGKAKHVGGKVKEGLGELLGDNKMKREGRLAQQEGEAEQDAERARERVREAEEREAAARLARKQSERSDV